MNVDMPIGTRGAAVEEVVQIDLPVLGAQLNQQHPAPSAPPYDSFPRLELTGGPPAYEPSNPFNPESLSVKAIESECASKVRPALAGAEYFLQ